MSQPIPIDKQAHFWAGMAIVALLLPFFGPWAMVAGVLAGAAKELLDHAGAGAYDPRDFWEPLIPRNGQLLLVDTSSGVSLDLAAYGRDNAASFVRFLSPSGDQS